MKPTKYADEEFTSFTVTFGDTCNHDTGWYAAVRFAFLYRQIYVCSKCGHLEYKGGWTV